MIVTSSSNPAPQVGTSNSANPTPQVVAASSNPQVVTSSSIATPQVVAASSNPQVVPSSWGATPDQVGTSSANPTPQVGTSSANRQVVTSSSRATPQVEDEKTVYLPVFEVGNYEAWSKKMVDVLTSQHLWDIVRWGYELPKDTTDLAKWKNSQKDGYREAQNKNAKAWMLIHQAVGVEIMAKVFASDDSTKKITGILKSFDKKRYADKPNIELIGEVLREPHMVEVAATSHDVWKMLKTYSDKHKENQKTTPEESKPVQLKTSPMDLHLEDTTRSSLSVYAMSDSWDKVIETYTRKSVAHCAKITNSGDTALHIAVIGGKKTTVEQLVSLMSFEEAAKALRVKNERGNTPLHLAAFVGNASLCDCLASKIYSDEEFRNSSRNEQDKNNQNSSEKIEAGYDILGERNNEKETPLFLAAVMGKTDAFLCLHGHVLPSYRKSYYTGSKSYYTGNKGDTILHVAISGEYFDLAFQIIHLYPKLVDMKNERGMSPLHCLASRHAAFKSGVHLRPYHNIIYHCTFVDRLKWTKDKGEGYIKQSGTTNQPSQNENNNRCPDNYQTCFHFFTSMYRAFICITGIQRQVKQGELLPTTSQASHDTNNGLSPIKKSISWLKKVLGEDQEQVNLRSSREGRLVPPNYDTIVELLKLGSKAMLVILGLGSMEIRKIRLKKEKHTWSVQVMNELLREGKLYKFESSEISGSPKLRSELSDSVAIKQFEGSEKGEPASSNKLEKISSGEPASSNKLEKPETPLLIAARNGITEIMEKILHDFPHAVHDEDKHKKNVVLLAVQYRQPHVYQFLLKRRKKNKELDRIFLQFDDQGNSARHLAAATIGDYKPWRIPGAALQLQWEIKWYKYVKKSMPQNFFRRLNYRSETPKEIFNKSHQELVKSGGAWLTNTSQSCSVVAALIATVAFATSANVPGGNAEQTGTPFFENHIAFKVFAVSSLVALCFSITSVIMFLAILTSRYEAKDFGEDLPTKVLLGLTSLFVSIAAILLCFCAGHFFVLSDELKFAAFPLYGVTCLPVTFFAIAQFPLYIDLIKATLATVPQRRYVVDPAERDTHSSPKSDNSNQPSSHKSLPDQGNGG
ncbi:uncharacterized protein LOC133690947 isoform X2 [Populus nigra]|uniref:uncharacterized protein LOC133690947 isoform X2 n=1 Tax=Populus nigra TaxID=3691 RepID=UPI002B2691EF|nr:uncharacterized protein LOC133690947 isoform X2 [Populus nigra]